MSEGTATPGALRVIRVALLAGVVIFGTVVFYLTREGPVSDVPAETARYLSFVLTGLTAASLAALLVVRSVRENTADREKKSSLTVVGWALGEAPALLGAVSLPPMAASGAGWLLISAFSVELSSMASVRGALARIAQAAAWVAAAWGGLLVLEGGLRGEVVYTTLGAMGLALLAVGSRRQAMIASASRMPAPSP